MPIVLAGVASYVPSMLAVVEINPARPKVIPVVTATWKITRHAERSGHGTQMMTRDRFAIRTCPRKFDHPVNQAQKAECFFGASTAAQ